MDGDGIGESDRKSGLTVQRASRSNEAFLLMATKIRGIEGMKHGELDFEIQRGGKFVLFQYCVSVVVLTFRRPSDIYFLRSGRKSCCEGAALHLALAVAGWWGIPWGPIYTIQSIYNNSRGARTSRRPWSNRSVLQPRRQQRLPIPPRN